MAWVKGLYVKARCVECLRWIEVQVTAKGYERDVEAIKQDHNWRCAECGSGITDELRAAFDGDDVPRKNIALRKAHDEIVRLGGRVVGCLIGTDEPVHDPIVRAALSPAAPAQKGEA